MNENENGQATYNDLQSVTNMHTIYLDQAVTTLLRGKIILIKRKKSEAQQTFNSEDIFCFNPNFRSKTSKFQVRSSLKKTEDVEKTTRKMKKARGYVIDACIVRIMKARK